MKLRYVLIRFEQKKIGAKKSRVAAACLSPFDCMTFRQGTPMFVLALCNRPLGL